MSSGSNTKYSWMSDAEFLRVAEGVIGLEVLEEALHRLADKGSSHSDLIEELEEETDRLRGEVYRLETVIEDLEQDLEHA